MKSVRKFQLILVIVAGFCHGLLMAEVLKDPTMPPGFRSQGNQSVGIKAAPRFVLSSTLIAPARRLATINGKTVAVGQKVAGARVVSIEPARVALQDGDRTIILKLLPRNIKRTH